MSLYFLIKAAHVCAMVTWFAGMLLVPLLLVYRQRAQAAHTSEWDQLAHLLMKRVVTPTMMITLILGVGLVLLSPAWLKQGWLHLKLFLVLLLTGYHGYLAATRRKLTQGKSAAVGRLYAMVFIPWIILFGAVFLVVAKPSLGGL